MDDHFGSWRAEAAMGAAVMRAAVTGAPDSEDSVSNIEIYTSPLCGFCHRAKRLLNAKGLAFTEIDVLMDPAAKAAMVERADGRRTVPQIFIDGVGVGGSDELHALEARGELDALVAG